MPAELAALVAFVVALVGGWALTPIAIRLAHRLDFHDQPNVDYKRHRPATPYLGGSAVMAALLAGAVASGAAFEKVGLLVLAALVLWALGTADDRVGIGAVPRVVAEAVIGAALWATDLGWDIVGYDLVNLALTVFWVVAIVNAFNLLDNMDGTAGTVGAVIGLGIAATGVAEGSWHVAALALAASGACLGFLRYNLPPPARIYLGDGGSLPLGFLFAALVMALPLEQEVGKSSVLAGAMLIGIPILDTTLVSISRARRGASLLTGGRDHTTHRLAAKLGSTWKTALVLGVVQLALALLALGATSLGAGWTLSAAVLSAGLGVIALAVFESPGWAPVYQAGARTDAAEQHSSEAAPQTAPAG